MKKLFLLTTFVALLTQIGFAQNSSFDKNAFCKKLEKELVKINDSLYASKFECSISNYRTFLNDLKSQGKDVAAYFPDTLAGWEKDSFMWDRVPYYLKHPAYFNYPIFSITSEAAKAYCNWLTEIYSGYSDRKFQNIMYTLPTPIEWETAALSFKNKSQEKKYYKMGVSSREYIDFTWLNDNLYEENNRRSKYVDLNRLHYRSMSLWPYGEDFRKANFQDEFYQSQQTEPVKSFSPSNNGMYNVCGNVAEMTLDPDVTKGGSYLRYPIGCTIHQTFEQYNIPNRDVGFRVFMKVKQ